MILLLTGCSSYYRKEEDYNYLSNNSIRFIRDDTTCFLINRNDIYYLLYFDYFDSDIYSDYYIDLNDIDSGIVINDLVIKRNDKIEINIDNYNFCIYIKELDRDNYGNCDFLYLYDIDDDFYITLNNDIYISIAKNGEDNKESIIESVKIENGELIDNTINSDINERVTELENLISNLLIGGEK